jgi:hypothetical protein
MVPYVRPVDRSVDRPARFEGELAAMQAVADALTALSPEARERVLQWAIDLFQARDRVTPPPGAASVHGTASDAGLSVAGLEDLFECRPASQRDDFRIVEFTPRADTLANNASADDLTLEADMLLDAAEERRPEPPAVPITPPAGPAAQEPQPVLSMLHSFVEDFQKLAREWDSD